MVLAEGWALRKKVHSPCHIDLFKGAAYLSSYVAFMCVLTHSGCLTGTFGGCASQLDVGYHLRRTVQTKPLGGVVAP